MGGRVVHRVYAEDDEDGQTREFDVQPPDDEQAREFGAHPPDDEQAHWSGDHRSTQPAWRFPRQPRVVAMALLGAAVAFVVTLAIHALLASQPQSVAQLPHRVTVNVGEGVPDRAPMKRLARRARPRVMRRRPSSSALTGEARAVAPSSIARAAPVAVARAVGSEFNFER
jgi:hypothetical protein